MIRLATLADKPRLIELSARFLLGTDYGALFDNQATPAKLDEVITSVINVGAIVVAEVRDDVPFDMAVHPWHEATVCATCSKVVGMLAIVVVPHLFAGVPCAEEIAWWVEPEHRHGTLGPKMLRFAVDWATTKGAVMCKMVAPAGSTVGKFYEHLGYRAVETAYLKRI